MARRPLAAAIIICTLVIVLGGGAIALIAWVRGGDLKGIRGFSDNNIGIVTITGPISQVGPVLLSLERFRKDPSIRGILLRVDSPGGGVAACQEIYAEIQRINKIKPVVASMGAVAASGGYYVSAPCKHIMANPGTITGSLGVIMSLPNLKGLFDKIGIEMQIIKSGALKGTGAATRPLTDEERAMLQKVSDDIHEQFIEDVANGRSMDLKEVRLLADGGIMSGRKAMELGLVDSLGNFNDAVRKTADLAGIEGKPNLVWPKDKDKSMLSRLLDSQVRAIIKLIKEEITSSAGYSVPAYIFHPYQSQ